MCEDDIKSKVSSFKYFNQWDDNVIQTIYKIAKIKKFPSDEIILSGRCDRKSYVYFVTKGICRLIEKLTLAPSKNHGKKETFINVCTFNRLACFNIGENLKNRQIVAITDTECLLIPFYWLLEHNDANIWIRIQQFLTWNIPKTENIVQEFQHEKKWYRHKRKLIKNTMKRKVETIGKHDVPYSLKVCY